MKGSLTRCGLAAAGLVLAGTHGLVTAAATASAAGEPIDDEVVGTANPDLELACGGDVALLLDGSGSIEEGGATNLVVAAAQSYVAALTDTGSRVAVVNFNSVAAIAQDYQPVTVSSSAPGGSHWMAIHDGPPNGYQLLASASTGRKTNWEAGLTAVGSLGPPQLLVFVTDGVPSAWLDHTGATVDAPDTVEGVREATVQAEDAAEALRIAGTHILGIAVGPLTDEVTPANYRNDPPLALDLLTQVVEPTDSDVDLYYPDADGESATFEVAADDAVLVDDFELLGSRLRELATSQCGSPTPPVEPPPAALADTGPSQTLGIGALAFVLVLIGTVLSRTCRRTQDVKVGTR